MKTISIDEFLSRDDAITISLRIQLFKDEIEMELTAMGIENPTPQTKREAIIRIIKRSFVEYLEEIWREYR